MKNFTSKSALLVVLLMPCVMFGSISDVASSIASMPGKVVRGMVSAAQYTVDGVARVEGTAVKTVLHPFVSMTKAGAEFLENHETAIFRMMSLTTLAYAGYMMQKMYKDRCPLACKKACSKN